MKTFNELYTVFSACDWISFYCKSVEVSSLNNPFRDEHACQLGMLWASVQ